MSVKRPYLNFVDNSAYLNLVATDDLVLPDDVCEEVNPPVSNPPSTPRCPPCLCNSNDSAANEEKWKSFFWLVVGVSMAVAFLLDESKTPTISV